MNSDRERVESIRILVNSFRTTIHMGHNSPNNFTRAKFLTTGRARHKNTNNYKALKGRFNQKMGIAGRKNQSLKERYTQTKGKPFVKTQIPIKP